MLDGKILEKPKSPQEAFQMLKSLSSSVHFVISGMTLILPKKLGFPLSSIGPLTSTLENGEPHVISFFEKTQVTFDTLSDDMIQAYVETGSPLYVPLQIHNTFPLMV